MPLLTGILAELVIGIGIVAVLLIVYKLGKLILKLIFGLIANSILGFVTIFLANSVFRLGIPYNLPIFVATTIFGLPAVGTLVILKLLGVSLALA